MSARRKSKPPDGAFWVAEEGHRPRFVDSGGSHHIQATEAFYRLIELMFPAVEERSLSTAAQREIKDIVPDIRAFYPKGLFAAIRVATPEQRKALNELFICVLQALEASHQKGIERGKSLLVQLAKGGLTNKEFNECAIKGEDDEG